jgi:hypothetical protein
MVVLGRRPEAWPPTSAPAPDNPDRRPEALSSCSASVLLALGRWPGARSATSARAPDRWPEASPGTATDPGGRPRVPSSTSAPAPDCWPAAPSRPSGSAGADPAPWRLPDPGAGTAPPAGRGIFPVRFRASRLAIYPLRVLLCPEPRSPARPAERPEPAARADGFGRGGTTFRSRTISTTVAGGSMTPTPQRTTTGSEPPSRAIAVRCSVTSSAADAPFSANSRPPTAASGRHQPASRSSGATARAVTTSAATGGSPARSSARPRTTVTVESRPSAVTASDRKAVRRASGSTRVIMRSGRATASTIPGKPAPDPTSTTEAPTGIISDITAQLSMCRSHTRGASRGPISPRTTPSVISSSA